MSRYNTKTFIVGQNTLYPSVNYLSEQSLTKCYRTALLHLWGILQPLSKHEIIFRADCRASCQALHSSSISTSILILTAIQYFGDGTNFDNLLVTMSIQASILTMILILRYCEFCVFITVSMSKRRISRLKWLCSVASARTHLRVWMWRRTVARWRLGSSLRTPQSGPGSAQLRSQLVTRNIWSR